MHITQVTRDQIKENITRLHSKYLDSHDADHLSRLKLRKTQFNAQLHHSNIRDDPFCEICRNNSNTEVQEDYKHALYACQMMLTKLKLIANLILLTYYLDD